MSKSNRPDPEELLFTLNQLEQTAEVMGRVISRLKRQVAELAPAAAHSPKKRPVNRSNNPKPPRRTLH
ncbi:hypothetical protein [Gilvimarinus agarilyticus]|uniref:hypothetical protein n=1 Tax=Gilvimarinus agarilyticus TaxID=679259 RepID=UPI0005A13514|nr:hypothetical protein [Gilvimarinus agarilyticus]